MPTAFQPLQLRMAKEEKSGETTQFMEQMGAEMLGWENPAAHLREALDQDHLCLYGQPIIDMRADGGIAMVEALVEQLLVKKGKGAIRALEQTEGQLHRTGAYVPARRG